MLLAVNGHELYASLNLFKLLFKMWAQGSTNRQRSGSSGLKEE